MASQRRSPLDPFVIMFSVPLGMIGVIRALLPANTNQLRQTGALQAVMQAGRTRLRSIIMTSLAALFEVIPMAFGIDIGSGGNTPLAGAVIGGSRCPRC